MNAGLLPDIPRIYTAIAEWVACIIYILPLKKRFQKEKMVFISVVALLVQALCQHAAGKLPLMLWIPGMVVNVNIMFMFIFISCDVSMKDAWYTCARALITAEFVSSLEWQLYCNILETGMGNSKILSYLSLLVIYGIVFLLIYLWEKKVIVPGTQTGASYPDVLAAVLMVVVVFSLSNFGFLTYAAEGGQAIGEMLFLVRTIVDFCGICLLNLQQKQRRENELKRELEAINNVFSMQYEQYKTFKENDEMISTKYHDLKHKIEIIRSETDEERRDLYLKDMDDALKRHEAENVTGNAVLDTILTGKSMYCASHDIILTCVADGKLLEHMEVMDICTIFGNALDNAIEHVRKLEEAEKKLVRVEVHQKNNFLIICFENYCEKKPEFEEGIPKTTKKNSSYHGYGVKSIHYTVEKYHGSMTINWENEWFVLRILIPLPKM